MFDSIGRDLDELATRREAVSTVLGMALSVALAALFAVVGWQKVRETIQVQPVEAVVDLAFLDAEAAEQLEVPAPPMPRGEANDATPAPAANLDAPEAPEADTEPVNPTPAPPPPDEVASSQPPTAPAAEPSSGRQDGITDLLFRSAVARARPTVEQEGTSPEAKSAPTAQIRSTGAEGFRWRRINDPDWPAFAKGYEPGAEEHCDARIELDHLGEPVTVSVGGCPKLFLDETRRALQTWRAYPVDSGSPVRVTDVVVRFRQI